MNCDLGRVFPCKVEAENWYWSYQLQKELYARNIKWGENIPAGWNSRTRKHLAIEERHDGGYFIAWMTKLDFEERSDHLNAVTAKELLSELGWFDKKGCLKV